MRAYNPPKPLTTKPNSPYPNTNTKEYFPLPFVPLAMLEVVASGAPPAALPFVSAVVVPLPTATSIDKLDEDILGRLLSHCNNVTIGKIETAA